MNTKELHAWQQRDLGYKAPEQHVGVLAGYCSQWRQHSAELESQLEQEHDIRTDRETTITMVSEALGVRHEPHQTFWERLPERAEQLAKQVEVMRLEREGQRAQIDALIAWVSRIQSLAQSDYIVLPDGRRMSFEPPDELVRESWHEISKAIRAARPKPPDGSAPAPADPFPDVEADGAVFCGKCGGRK